MSAPQNCNPCCSSDVTTQYPGLQGDAGTNGVNAFSSAASITFDIAGNSATCTCSDNSWISIGQHVIVSDGGSNYANMRVTAKPVGTTQFTGVFLGFPGDASSGSITGGTVSPSGYMPALSAALPAVITDNSGGAQSNAIAAGVGITTLSFFVNLAEISASAADFLTSYTPGYAFSILSVNFAVEKAVTTAAKAATISAAITGSAITGGVIALTSANCTPRGVVVAGSAVTAANTGTASSTISLTTSSVTAFAEGSGWVILRIRNLDTTNALATLAAYSNALINALS